MHAYGHYAHVPTSLSHKTESIFAHYISFDLDLEKREFGHKAKAANWKNKHTRSTYICMYRLKQTHKRKKTPSKGQ